MFTFLTKRLLFPPFCAHCRQFLTKREVALCDACRSTIIINATLFCGRCQNRLPNNRQICHHDSYILGAASDYSCPPLRSAIQALKFESARDTASFMSNILICYIEQLRPPPAFLQHRLPPLLVPVPLSAERQRERGFNQSDLIATSLSEYFNWPLAKDCLTRRKHSPPQSSLKSKVARQKNVSGVFCAARPDKYSYSSAVLIDDITTTGATLAEAQNALRSQNISVTAALVVCR